MKCTSLKGLLRHSAIVFATSLVAAGAVPFQSAIAQTIKVGVPLPQTGAASRWGAFSLRGANLAVDTINAAGGIDGRKLELIPADTQCVPAEGVSATQRLLNISEVDVILGPMCSSVGKAIQPIVDSAKIPMLMAATSDPEITYKAGAGGYKWTFRNYPTDEIRALVLLKGAANRDIKRLAFLAIDNDFGRSAVAFNKKYQERFPGMEFSSIDFFGLKETDFRPVLSKIKAADAQAVMLFATGGDTIQVLGRQMRELGLAGKVKVMGIGDLTHPENIKALPDVLEGAVESTLWVPGVDHPRSKQFVEDYQKAYGGEVPNFLAYSYWESVQLLAKAIREAKGTKPEALQKAFQTMEYESVLGPVRFDDHHQANLPMLLLEVKDGSPVPLGTFFSQPAYPKN